MQLEKTNASASDEARPMGGGTGKVEILRVGGSAIGKATCEPGGRWSEHDADGS